MDSAFALAERFYPNRKGATPAAEDRLWLDDPDRSSTSYLASSAAAPLRRDPRFLPLADRLGLLDYWRTGRLPDFCRDRPEPICARIGKVSRKRSSGS